MSETLKVFLDDIREAPEGWLRTYTATETIEVLKSGCVTDLSLDHDLGEEASYWETGYDVLEWLEEQVFYRRINKIPNIKIHSQNPVGAERMRHAVSKIAQILESNRVFETDAGFQNST